MPRSSEIVCIALHQQNEKLKSEMEDVKSFPLVHLPRKRQGISRVPHALVPAVRRRRPRRRLLIPSPRPGRRLLPPLVYLPGPLLRVLRHGRWRRHRGWIVRPLLRVAAARGRVVRGRRRAGAGATAAPRRGRRRRGAATATAGAPQAGDDAEEDEGAEADREADGEGFVVVEEAANLFEEAGAGAATLSQG